jgi:hypothetical protein
MKSIRNLAAHIREVSQHFGSKRLSPAAASKLNCRFEKMALATILCSLQLVRFQILEEDRVALKMTIVSQNVRAIQSVWRELQWGFPQDHLGEHPTLQPLQQLRHCDVQTPRDNLQGKESNLAPAPLEI